ncbi:porin family protein [Jejudonia soesokkakensis]|uniref:Porin family protein n=1 Tax=Jejudonia soesokkakensis TaxID=1323432 RepID=A0ABW2MR42_9FLAO
MRKLFLLSIFIVLGCITSQAQISFGAKAGVNFASLQGDDADDIEGQTTINIGGIANIGITELLAVQPELVYSRQGFKSDENDITVFLDYLTIPVMADFTIAEGLSLQGGPQVGININSIIKDDETENEEDLDNVEGLDLGMGIGAQYRLPMGLFFQARYVAGLNNVFEDIEGESVDAKNSVISVSIGWFF